MFQLKERLRKARSSVLPNDSAPTADDLTNLIDNDEVIIEMNMDCGGKSDEGNRKLKAYFGRRRTHNEQLIMRPCGVILSRATFYGAEAISSVNVS